MVVQLDPCDAQRSNDVQAWMFLHLSVRHRGPLGERVQARGKGRSSVRNMEG